LRQRHAGRSRAIRLKFSSPRRVTASAPSGYAGTRHPAQTGDRRHDLAVHQEVRCQDAHDLELILRVPAATPTFNAIDFPTMSGSAPNTRVQYAWLRIATGGWPAGPRLRAASAL
jgi:hypothetical protein